MSRIYVKNGTPVETDSLCTTCTYAHILRGYRESEEKVFCNYVYQQLIPITFKIRECSGYSDKNKPSWEEMEELAIEVRPGPTFKHVGFRSRSECAQVTADEDEAVNT